MKFRSILLGAAALALSSAALAQSSGDDTARLKKLYTDEWKWRQAEFAQTPDDDAWSGSADHLPRVDAATQAAHLKYWTNVLDQLKTIDPAKLDAEEEVNYAVLKTSLEAMVDNIRYRYYEAPFNSDSNFWASLPPRQGYQSAEQYRRYIGRMRDVPRYFDEQIANMRAGIKRGFTIPKVTLTGRDMTIVPFTNADVEKNPFYAAFVQMPATIPAAERERLRAEARAAISGSIVPAYSKLLGFVRNEYIPNARTTIAAEALPDGKAFYQAQIRQYTTLDLTPGQIHQIGLREVARIDAEMTEVQKRAGFTGSRAEFLHFLRTDPQFYAKTPLELLSRSAYIVKRVDGKLKNIIGTLPRYRFTILPVPAAIAPYYTSGRGGLDACLMNTYDLPSRPLYQLTALTLHECNPGHSFQAAVALEQPGRPAFRKRGYFSGYGEGWGLYTEWLGYELGVYDTPYDEFGQLSFEMWRACRLVIDTGMHHMGWTRQQAIDYLAAHTALAQHDVETEVDRYIGWPGQADAYMLGKLTIMRLRKEAETKLGDRFDERAFHDTLLSLASVPLPVLEHRMNEFIAGGGKAIMPKPM